VPDKEYDMEHDLRPVMDNSMGPLAFGSLLDLARLHIGGAPAETCDACSTIHGKDARRCKCCAHRLPAFYARTESPRRKPGVEAGRAWASLFIAVSFLLHSLSAVIRFGPGLRTDRMPRASG
jgi:hypothetical protein